MSFSKESKIGVIGAGAMGTGISQVAAAAGHKVIVTDTTPETLEKSRASISKVMDRLVEKDKMSRKSADGLQERIEYSTGLADFSECSLVIEAIIEDVGIKKNVFTKLESILFGEAVIATNTSSLSIASLSSAFEKPERFLGIHFFNPPPLMPLVEIIPSFITNKDIIDASRELINSWGKTTVTAKDTPGFIVNRVARPFYGEAMRIYEEGIANIPTIDWAMRETGGFRMGPFELTDYIGHDVNYTVSETVFTQFYFDPRFRPSLIQKRLLEAGFLGRKSGRGFYDYRDGAVNPEPLKDENLGKQIFDRILLMLINEAADAVFMNIASPEDVETAMTKGVNYPKGLLKWGDEIAWDKVLAGLENLQSTYGEDRYRPNPLVRKMASEGKKFFE